MIEIIGKYNTAKCFATTLEGEAREQIKAVLDIEAFSSSRIRIMPDVHAGKGCTIGTTMTVTDKIVPAMVGVDIGCGMYTVYLGKTDVDFEKVDEAAHYIPSGRDVWEGRQERFDLTALRCYRELWDSRRLERSLGTLGGGNHFIEIDEDDGGGKYLVVHSGHCVRSAWFSNSKTPKSLVNTDFFGSINAPENPDFRALTTCLTTYKKI